MDAPALALLQPPTISEHYSPELALDDLPAIKYAAALFLNSSMVESENYCMKVDPRRYAFISNPCGVSGVF